jgi:hypothetical protein
VIQPSDLSPFASKLAAAIAYRHALDRLSTSGEAVPAEIAHLAEASVRAAELDLVRTRAGSVEA